MPTINEIKKLYPVGTVFFPAHLTHDDGSYVTVKDYHGYRKDANGNIISTSTSISDTGKSK